VTPPRPRPARREELDVPCRGPGTPWLRLTWLARRRAPVPHDRKRDEDNQDGADPGHRLKQCGAGVGGGQQRVDVEEAPERVGENRDGSVAREGRQRTWPGGHR